MPSLPQSLIVRSVVLRVPNPLRRKMGTGSRMKPQGEMVSHLLHHKSMGLDGIHPGALKGSAHQATFHHLSAVLVNWGGPS